MRELPFLIMLFACVATGCDSSLDALTSAETTPGAAALTISPAAPDVVPNGTIHFSASGGVQSYVYSVISGGGTLNGSVYTAPPSTGTAEVQVADQNGETSVAQITIIPPTSTIVINAFSPTGSLGYLASNATPQFFLVSAASLVGGTLSYTWTLTPTVGSPVALGTNSTGAMSLTPSSYGVGTYALSCLVADGYSTITQSWDIEIDQNPVITPTAPAANITGVTVGGTLAFSANVSGSNGNSLAATWLLNGVASGFLSGSLAGGVASATLTADSSLVGANNITLQISDGYFTTSQAWATRVNYLNPACNSLSQGQICTYVGWAGLGSGNSPTSIALENINYYDFDAAGNVYFLDDPQGTLSGVLWLWNRGATPIVFGSVTVAPGTAGVIAGNGGVNGVSANGADGTLLQSMIYAPSGVAVDPVSGDVFVAGYSSGMGIGRLSKANGNWTSIAPANEQYQGLRYYGGNIYYGNSLNGRIYSYGIDSAATTTLAGNGTKGYAGDGLAATNASVELNGPSQIAFDSNDNLYVSDFTSCSIRIICATTAAGICSGATRIDGSNRLRLDTANGTGPATTGNIYTLAGNGTCNFPTNNSDPATTTIPSYGGLEIEPATGNIVYSGYYYLYYINTTGSSATFLGTSVPAYSITQVAGDQYVVGLPGQLPQQTAFSNWQNQYSYPIFRFDPLTNDLDYNFTLSSSYGFESYLRAFDIGGGTNTVLDLAGGRTYGMSPEAGSLPADTTPAISPDSLVFLQNGNLIWAEHNSGSGYIRDMTQDGVITTLNKGSGAHPTSGQPMNDYGGSSPFVAGDGTNDLLIADNDADVVSLWNAGSSTLAELGQSIATNIVTFVAGTGSGGYNGAGSPATSYKINNPQGLAYSGGNLYLADTSNGCVRMIDSSGTMSDYAGVCGSIGAGGNGLAPTSTQMEPYTIAADTAGIIYVTDASNNTIRAINTTGGSVDVFGQTIPNNTVYIVAGGGADLTDDNIAATTASISGFQGLALDPSGNLYFSEYNYYMVREVYRSGANAGKIVTVAGNVTSAYPYSELQYDTSAEGATASSTYIYHPTGLAFDANGDLYIGEEYMNVIRKVKLSP